MSRWAWGEQVPPIPAGREFDMLLTAGERISMALLAMAIKNLGHEAQSFTGSQAGGITAPAPPRRLASASRGGAPPPRAGGRGAEGGGKKTPPRRRGGGPTAPPLALA